MLIQTKLTLYYLYYIVMLALCWAKIIIIIIYLLCLLYTFHASLGSCSRLPRVTGANSSEFSLNLYNIYSESPRQMTLCIAVYCDQQKRPGDYFDCSRTFYRKTFSRYAFRWPHKRRICFNVLQILQKLQCTTVQKNTTALTNRCKQNVNQESWNWCG